MKTGLVTPGKSMDVMVWTAFLKNNGFWTAVGMEVSNVPPPMRGQSKREKNVHLMLACATAYV